MARQSPQIIVIDRETLAREAVFYDTDSIRAARRKLPAILSPPTESRQDQ
jgi:hypothetical protein